MSRGFAVAVVSAACLAGAATMADEYKPEPSEPASCVAYVTPYIIHGDNPGGNRTCEEVSKAFNGPYYDGSFKSDKDDLYSYLPKWLNVKVTDGKHVSFYSYGPKIGAVIVKGGPKANVYHYEYAVKYDNCLAPPKNHSGKPADLSNITFCWKKPDKPY
jgi:hypothetical protein